MPNLSLLRQLTGDTLACRKCYTDDTTFVDGKTVLGEWAPPRGWAGQLGTATDIVFVSLNPGLPFPGEIELYEKVGIIANPPVKAISDQQLESVCTYGMEQFSNPKRGQNWVFHRKSSALAHALLCMMDGAPVKREDVWARTWFTDVFKCTTRRESGPRISINAELTCRRHLLRELDLLRPRLLVALGGRVTAALTRAGIPHVPFRHPANGCPSWDNGIHDQGFLQAASTLAIVLPRDFRETRRNTHEEAFRAKG